MGLFDKKYVHFMWEDELDGKKGFVANNINEMKEIITSDCSDMTTVTESDHDAFPFNDGIGSEFRFFYYDPNYECKRAYAEGKQIQYKYLGQEEWHDVESEADLTELTRESENTSMHLTLRVKPEEPKSRRMTHRQASEWVSKNGEITFNVDRAYVFNDFSYDIKLGKEELPEEYKIRRWGSDEWIEPTVDVYEADCKKEG